MKEPWCPPGKNHFSLSSYKSAILFTANKQILVVTVWKWVLL